MNQMEKRCWRCREVKPLDLFSRNSGTPDGCGNMCRVCSNAYAREWRKKHPGRAKARDKSNNSKYRDKRSDHKLRARVGITLETYNDLASQRKLCAICGDPPADGARLCVDHDHKNGDIRGLLCHGCNKGLGHFKDDPERLRSAIAYLARPPLIKGSDLPTTKRGTAC